jgi:cupin fold WbuC family metalloprotein
MKSLNGLDLAALSDQAAVAPRLRAHYNLHVHLDDPVQRLAIAMQPGTYVRPHRHPGTWEVLCPLAGSFDLIIFDEHGCVQSRQRLGAGGAEVVEMPAGTWHAVISLESGSVVFEVKQGPYLPLTAQDLAAWSPAEGDAAVGSMLEFLAHAAVGERFTAV